MSKRRISLSITVAAAGWMWIASDQAASAGPLAAIAGEVLDVSAKELSVDLNTAEAVLQGDVAITLGDLRVHCPRVEISYDEAPQVKWAKGSGGVHAELRGIIADAAIVEVDVPARRVKLAGGVKLSRGRGWVHADEALIDIKTHHVTLQEVKGSIPVKAPRR